GLKKVMQAGWPAMKRTARDLFSATFPGERRKNSYYSFDEMGKWEAEHGVRSASYVLFEKRRWKRALVSGEWQHVIGVYQPRSIFNELKEYESKGNEIGVHGSFDSWADPEALTSDVENLRSGGI